MLRDLYQSIPLDRKIPTHHVQRLSDLWLKSCPYFGNLVLQASTFKLLATERYRHADTSRPIPVSPSCRADSNGTLSNPSGHLPAVVSAFFSLVSSIAMQMLRDLNPSIPLNRRITMHPDPMVPDCWLKCYPFFCTLVPQASTFKLLATECYRHADTSRPIPFNPSRRANSNAILPNPSEHLRLPAEESGLSFLLTSIAI